jgi:hypothetical protein
MKTTTLFLFYMAVLVFIPTSTTLTGPMDTFMNVGSSAVPISVHPRRESLFSVSRAVRHRTIDTVNGRRISNRLGEA